MCTCDVNCGIKFKEPDIFKTYYHDNRCALFQIAGAIINACYIERKYTSDKIKKAKIEIAEEIFKELDRFQDGKQTNICKYFNHETSAEEIDEYKALKIKYRL